MPSKPSTTWALGKTLAMLAAVLWGVLPAFIDTLDPAHLRNPAWPPHARQHLLWGVSTGAWLAVLGLVMFATATPRTVSRVYVGAAAGGAHIAGFFTAAVFKDLAGGAFDADGRVLLGFLPPAVLHFSTAAALLAAGVALCRRAAEASHTTPSPGATSP